MKIVWDDHVRAWSSPPVDDVGYVPANDLLKLNNHEFMTLIERMRTNRYGGWRNHENRWRDVMGLDDIRDRDVLDFGCGVGVESLELARLGNRVSLADISASNLLVAARTLLLHDIAPSALHIVTSKSPFIQARRASFDVFYCNGVLHHIPWARAIMERAHELLRQNGEVRLMLYSDVGWRIATDTDPPTIDTTAHPKFQQFVRYFDAVGTYADWYNEVKIRAMFGDLFEIVRCEYLTNDDRYIGAILKRKC